tara:strand:- start:469 stop:699 length:231 start_codon:yes stop_codon:yes gene_type:complete
VNDITEYDIKPGLMCQNYAFILLVLSVTENGVGYFFMSKKNDHSPHFDIQKSGFATFRQSAFYFFERFQSYTKITK